MKKIYWITSLVLIGIVYLLIYLPLPVESTQYGPKRIACEDLINIYGCEVSTDIVKIKGFDANKNGEFDDGDTLLALCQNWYNISTDDECKKSCDCEEYIRLKFLISIGFILFLIFLGCILFWIYYKLKKKKR